MKPDTCYQWLEKHKGHNRSIWVRTDSAIFLECYTCGDCLHGWILDVERLTVKPDPACDPDLAHRAEPSPYFADRQPRLRF